MAQIRTLKLNLLADTKSFSSGLKSANNQTESFSSKVGDSFKKVAKAAAVAGVAVGGAAIAFGVDAVKAAIDDEKSQTRLAKALKNVTGATKAQVGQVEKLISKLQLQYGVSDTKLRPAYQRLIQSTKSFQKTQDLLNLALDVSAGTGKDVETVSNALAKAYDGNYGALKKLGVSLDDAKLKARGFKYAQEQLAKTYGGQATKQAETFAGKWARFNETISEAKETIGTAILRALQPLAEKWLPIISQGVTDFVNALTGKGKTKGLTGELENASKKAYDFGVKAKEAIQWIINHKEELSNLGKIVAAIFIGSKAYGAVKAMIGALALLRAAFATTTIVAGTTAAAEAAATGGASLAVALPAIAAIAAAFGIAGLTGLFNVKSTVKAPKLKTGDKVDLSAIGGPTYTVGNNGPKQFTSSRNSNNGSTTIINLNGIVDAESARRTIQNLMQQSSLRTGAVNLNAKAL